MFWTPPPPRPHIELWTRFALPEWGISWHRQGGEGRHTIYVRLRQVRLHLHVLLVQRQGVQARIVLLQHWVLELVAVEVDGEAPAGPKRPSRPFFFPEGIPQGPCGGGGLSSAWKKSLEKGALRLQKLPKIRHRFSGEGEWEGGGGGARRGLTFALGFVSTAQSSTVPRLDAIVLAKNIHESKSSWQALWQLQNPQGRTYWTCLAWGPQYPQFT